MKPFEIVILSGKGGTGKTVLTASFAALEKNLVTADCDVDAADLHLLLNPVIRETGTFVSGSTARIDPEKCVCCMQCRDLCRFGAIDENLVVDPVACEGCGLCSHVCSVEAVTMQENVSGDWYVSETRFGPLVHARLGIAEENSGRLVTLVRNKAVAIASQSGIPIVLIDGSPGIGCPVIASLTGSGFTVIVTEPTIAGLHDADRVIRTAQHFGVPAGIVINKCDLNPDISRRIELYARDRDLPVLGRIPFDEAVIQAMIEGKTVPEYPGASLSGIIEEVWRRIRAAVEISA